MSVDEITAVELDLLARVRELYDNAARSPSAALSENARRNHIDACAAIRSLAISARVTVSGEVFETEARARAANDNGGGQ